VGESQESEKIMTLAGRAEAGDAEALLPVRAFIDAEAPELWAEFGDVARRAEDCWLSRIAGKNLVHREAIERRLVELRAEIAGPAPSPLECLLVARIVVCWLTLHYYEHQRAATEGLTLEEANHYDRRLDRAQRRYLAAIKCLAQVRRLLGPTVQVNVAEKQVNIAGSSLRNRGGRDEGPALP
jgi:hypothetical protein